MINTTSTILSCIFLILFSFRHYYCNRRMFHVVVYITLFVNVIVGLVSCLMRIIKAVIFGVLFIGRIDRSTLMRGWELWDPGKNQLGQLAIRKIDQSSASMLDQCTLMGSQLNPIENWKSGLDQTGVMVHPFDQCTLMRGQLLNGTQLKTRFLSYGTGRTQVRTTARSEIKMFDQEV